MYARKLPIALSLLAFALTASTLQAASEQEVHQSGNVSYVSGGVSEGARDSLEQTGRRFNLKLVLATRSGAYLSDVNVAVDNARGQRVLDTTSQGPWFFANLPNGKYQIAASSNGTIVRKSVTVQANGQRTLDFRWND